ncbi:DNA-binding FadR family transcriptional regulator [Stakelama sediminis]|uniref:DNA-binding FadR family transcriptional regulator n=2 Tax=Stakelama sediminis TaxID=463200 RepID=A0A840YYT2_9SPHN|nr:DNA-binding FadR family transcriptional regulator [Stakelama sediminis]
MSSAEAKVRSPRKHGVIARKLAMDILAGRYAPGHILPGEIEFSEQLEVSRTAYREAVRILAAKGLVESRPKLGTRVLPRGQWNVLDPDILGWMFEGEPDEKFIHDLFELRMIIEPAAAALAAEKRSGTQLAMMGHALENMAGHGLATLAGREADQIFHRIILEAADNEPLVALTSSISAAISWTTSFKQRHRKLPRDPVPEHRNVYAAIADSDPDAARDAMRVLIELALQDTRETL